MALTNQELLEYVAPYLPYGVKWKLLGQTSLLTMSGLTYETLYIEEGAALNITPKKEFNSYLRLILRPLPDLTKPCLEGDRVPINELYDMFGQKLMLDEFNRLVCPITCEPFIIVKQLYRWHFDIYGLIEKGYAIDINTLKDGN